MNKMLMLLSLVLTSAFAFASPTEVTPLPSALHCDSVLSVYGKPGVFHRKAFAALTDISQKKAHWSEGVNSNEGVVQEGDENDKVVFDFGVGAVGGDQYSTFTFRKDDLFAMSRGTLSRISGLYEDGYDWADGYHTRELLVIECTK